MISNFQQGLIFVVIMVIVWLIVDSKYRSRQNPEAQT